MDNGIGTIGCGIMFTGLLLGALSNSIAIMLVVIGIGALCVCGALVQEHAKEQQAQAWRKRYPPYRY